MNRFAASLTRARHALLVGVLGTTFLGLLAWGEFMAWQAAVDRIEVETQNLAMALTQHAEDSLELAQIPLAEMVRRLEGSEYDKSQQAVQDFTNDLFLATPRLKGLFVYDDEGRFIANTAGSTAETIADREYFQYHRTHSSRTAYVGPPVKGKTTGDWVITVSRRYNTVTGEFGGVVTASFDMNFFSDYFGAALMGRKGAILLADAKGVVLARSPFDEASMGRNIAGEWMFPPSGAQALAMGSDRYVSPFDMVPRIGSFFRSARSGLLVIVAVSEAEALSDWAQDARMRWGAGGLVIFAAVMLAVLLARQSRKKRLSDESLARMEAEFRLLAENSSDMVERIDVDGVRLYVSPAAKRVTGLDASELLGGKMFDHVHPDDQAYVCDAAQRLRDGQACNTITFRTTHASGREIWLEANLSALPRAEDGSWTGAVAVTRDVTARKQLEVKLAAMATVDGLTGLANRRAFDEKLGLELRRAKRDKLPLSILMLDADRFKLFNDTYGHIAGDHCLRSISELITGFAKRPADMVARFGGEEIVVLLPNTDNQGAQDLAARMCAGIENLAIPHKPNAPWGVMTVSVGVATFSSTDGPDFVETELLHAADRALYRAKSTGRNRVMLADAEGLTERKAG